MTDEPAQVYKVGALPEVKKEIATLAIKAQGLGILPSYLDILKKTLAELEIKPLVWGDPQHSTRKTGGMVYFGARWPVIVR